MRCGTRADCNVTPPAPPCEGGEFTRSAFGFLIWDFDSARILHPPSSIFYLLSSILYPRSALRADDGEVPGQDERRRDEIGVVLEYRPGAGAATQHDTGIELHGA